MSSTLSETYCTMMKVVQLAWVTPSLLKGFHFVKIYCTYVNRAQVDYIVRIEKASTLPFKEKLSHAQSTDIKESDREHIITSCPR